MQRMLIPVSSPLSVAPVRPGPDLVPVVTCTVDALNRRVITVAVRNQGTEPSPRAFYVGVSVEGVNFPRSSGQALVTRIFLPGEQVAVISEMPVSPLPFDELIITAEVDVLNQIPEDTNKRNNRVTVRCFRRLGVNLIPPVLLG